MNQVLISFQHMFGKPSPIQKLWYHGKNESFLGEYERFSWEQSANIPMFHFCRSGSFLLRINTKNRTENISRNCSTSFKHIGPQVGPGSKVFWTNACKRIQQYWHKRRYEACALMSKLFSTALSCGKFLFSDEFVIYRSFLQLNIWGVQT